ncbi:hypothetical protein M1M25_gp112 [Tenacibaculum phage Gundel_1]|uniref:Uncharacterized protein n=1 Tax=Tenacibaculum phage Gundel_1 TaxID=2745672 RepID=A0A8E4ZK38_9CAUD|nr:hypothetical protein M1M25_gp112 [Tenacibaculum phage Gundel_1]QQV91428.1 hypothetical protein Gundel1_106 [Tenacibaculum phage Gundel_1]
MGKFYKQKKIVIPIYGQDMYFIDTNDCDKLNNTHATEEEKEPYAVALTLYKYKNGDSNAYYAIVLNTKSSHGKPSIGVLAHECLHIVNMISHNLGMKPDFKNDEPQAYLLDYLVDKAMKFYYPKTLI